ncbi:hypothetical protein RRF57_004955 [Xylaria bambusicola]|uniref:Uncharacterized protein n=1 Tax=Xylaria bambusicola TaxID=326684 RepID=A0AAN7YXD7_9PEZI
MSQGNGADLGRIRRGHGLEDAPRHALEELADEEHGQIPREEREENKPGHGDQGTDDGPAVAPALRYDSGDLYHGKEEKVLDGFKEQGT